MFPCFPYPQKYICSVLLRTISRGMVWNGKWKGMERKFRYGIWKMPGWNGMEDFKNGMEGNLPYFHTSSILDFAHGIHKKIYTDVA